MSAVSWASSDAVRRVMQANRSRDTGPELALRRELRRLGVTGYRVQWPLPLPGLRRTADVALPGRRLAVFVNGCYWHGCPLHRRPPRANAGYWESRVAANARRDNETDRLLLEAGWRVVRAWEHEDAAGVAARVAGLLR